MMMMMMMMIIVAYIYVQLVVVLFSENLVGVGWISAPSVVKFCVRLWSCALPTAD